MGVLASSDILQMKMMQMIKGLEEFLHKYLDDLLIIGKGSFDYHLAQLEKALKRIKEASLKVNVKKYNLFTTEIEYLGFWLTREEIKPVEKKIKAIQDLEVPDTPKLLKHFLGMVIFYRNMWRGRSHMITQFTELNSIQDKKKLKSRWT